MRKLLLIAVLAVSTVCYSQKDTAKKADSLRIPPDSIEVVTLKDLNNMYNVMGAYLSDKVTKKEWDAYMNVLVQVINQTIGEAVIRYNKKKPKK